MCVQLMGGPASERLAAKGDSVALTSSSGDEAEEAALHRMGGKTTMTSHGQRRYTLACGTDHVDYIATFTAAVDGGGRPVKVEAADEVEVEQQVAAEGATAKATVRVTCAAPEAVVVDLLSDLQRRTDTAEPSDALAPYPTWVHKVELAEAVAVAAAFTDSAGRWFANASTVALHWRVEPKPATLSTKRTATLLHGAGGTNDDGGALWAAAAALTVPAAMGKQATVRVHVEVPSAAADKSDRGAVAPLLTSNLTLQLVPPLALRPAAVAMWAGSSPGEGEVGESSVRVREEAVWLLGGTAAAVLAVRFDGHLAALVTSAELHAAGDHAHTMAAAHDACVPPNATAHVRFTLAPRPPPSQALADDTDSNDSDSDDDSSSASASAAITAAYAAVAREGLVGGWYTVTDAATGTAVQVYFVTSRPPTIG